MDTNFALLDGVVLALALLLGSFTYLNYKVKVIRSKVTAALLTETSSSDNNLANTSPVDEEKISDLQSNKKRLKFIIFCVLSVLLYLYISGKIPFYEGLIFSFLLPLF